MKGRTYGIALPCPIPMQLKHKIVTLSLLPLLLAVTVVGLLVMLQNQRLGEQQAQLIEQSIMNSKKAELRHYVGLALSTIAPLYESGDDEQTRQRVLDVLQRMSFGSDGYFFVYDRHGRNLMHPRQRELVGRDLWNMKDGRGLPVIQALLKSASEGDGFQPYRWRKPSSGEESEKLAYVVMLDRWGWMLGTGIYLDDVEQTLRQVRSDVIEGLYGTILTIGVVALIAVLLVYASGLTLNVSEHRLADRKLQQLTQRIITSQEEERSRVSRELHDGISQQLVSIKFQFELAAQQLDGADPRARATLHQGIEHLAGAIGEVRRISHDLHPSLLDTLGLSSAIGQLAAEFAQRSGLKVDYHDHLGEARPPTGMTVALFRILQEALTNIERHAQARHVEIDLHGTPRLIELRISDDGVGFDPEHIERSHAGIGLRNIRERVEHFGGQFLVSSQPRRTELYVALRQEPN